MLKELYLRKNEIIELNEVSHLKHLQNLKVLWLYENPCVQTPMYRLKIIWTLRNLVKLDDTEISPGERAQALSMNFENESNYPPIPLRNNNPQYQHQYEGETSQQQPKPQQKSNRKGERITRSPPRFAPPQHQDKLQGKVCNELDDCKTQHAQYPSDQHQPYSEGEDEDGGYVEPTRKSPHDQMIQQYKQEVPRSIAPSVQHQRNVPLPTYGIDVEIKPVNQQSIYQALLYLIKELDKEQLEKVKTEIEKLLF